jgi:hypothetical protein
MIQLAVFNLCAKRQQAAAREVLLAFALALARPGVKTRGIPVAATVVALAVVNWGARQTIALEAGVARAVVCRRAGELASCVLVAWSIEESNLVTVVDRPAVALEASALILRLTHALGSARSILVTVRPGLVAATVAAVLANINLAAFVLPVALVPSHTSAVMGRPRLGGDAGA